LENRARHKPQEISGGQQQRVAVARSIVGEPKLILADEPTGNLNTKNDDDVMNMLNMLKNNGTTILMVTHSPEHGAQADRVIEMLDGEVIHGPNPVFPLAKNADISLAETNG
jgi:putative ABC transport system ATP-binding protein